MCKEVWSSDRVTNWGGDVRAGPGSMRNISEGEANGSVYTRMEIDLYTQRLGSGRMANKHSLAIKLFGANIPPFWFVLYKKPEN